MLYFQEDKPMTRTMKDSGIEWIGEIPEDWNIEYSKRAFQVDKNIAGSQADEYPRLSLSNQGVIERSKYTGGGESPADYATYQIIPEGEFVFNFMGLEQDSVYRRVGIAPISGLVSAGYMKAIHNPKVINAQYGYYFFRFMEQDQLFKPYGTGIRSNLNKQQFLSIPLLLPPLSEQEKIASILDEKVARIDAIIADTKQSIEELKKYKQSLITETVTKGLDKDVSMKDSGIEWIGQIPEDWEVVKLKYLLNTDLQYGVNKPGVIYTETKPRYIRITDIDDNGNLKVEDKQSYIEEDFEKYLIKKRDILIARSGASVGKSYLHKNDGQFVFAGYLIKIECNLSKILPEFLYYYLNSSNFSLWKKFISTSSTIENIAADKYKELPIIVPNINYQLTILNFLDSKTQRINQMIQNKEALIAKYEEYKKSIIYEYVTGKINIRGENNV